MFTNWSGSVPVARDAPGNYVNYGVREFAMAAIGNGAALHGGFIPYAGTFLTFADYARNALRMAALMKLRAIFVFTHDSIGLGEDGPTHQPVEHAASLRLIPNLDVWRPCDTVETAVAWAAAIERRDGPSALLFTRQNVPFQSGDRSAQASIRRGGYVLADWPAEAAGAAGGGHRHRLRGRAGDGGARAPARRGDRRARGVDALHRGVRPSGCRLAGVGAAPGGAAGRRRGRLHRRPGAATSARPTTRARAVVGIDRFGESAPAAVLFRHFGITTESVAAALRRVTG